MIRTFRKKFLYLFILVLLLTSLSTRQAEAFSFNVDPITFLSEVADIITTGISNTINFLVTQKQYLFDGKTDSNVYSTLNIPSNIDKFLASTTSTTTTDWSGKPIVITNITIPGVKDIVAGRGGSQILTLTNKERAAVSLPPLSSNPTLDTIASERADDLFTNQYFDHASPDGKSAVDLAKNIGYSYLLIGENLALGNFGGDPGIVAAWMASPGHKANILNKDYTELGVSVKTGFYQGENNIIAVQIFGLPLANCAKPSQSTKDLIDSSTASIKQMQSDALTLFNNLNTMKNTPGLDKTYYNQKIQEYNYSAKKVNDAVIALKQLIDSYNIQVSKYNSCITPAK